MAKKVDYAALTSKQAKESAIAEAKSDEALEEMWAVWEKQGMSRQGMLYAMLLEKKKDLGVSLTDEQKALIQLADARWKAAKNLPPIRGSFRR